MRLNRVLVLTALLGAVATPARADIRDFGIRCSTGSMHTCASIQVITSLINGGGQGTSVLILIRNLQGAPPPVIDNTGGSVFTRIGLVAPRILGAANLTLTGTNGAQVIGNPAPLWKLSNPGGLGGPIELTAGVQGGQINGGIAGCDAPAGGFPSDYFRTCSGGWVQFSFTTTNDWSANNAQVALLSQNFANAPTSGVECDTQGGVPGQRGYCAAVTPEPVSMILVGSGLLGMGGMRFGRRRRGNSAASE